MRTGGVCGHAHGVATMWTPLFLGSVWRPLKKSFQRHPTPSFQDLSTSHALLPPCRGLGPLSTRQDAGPGRMGYRCCCTSRASPVSYRDALWYHPLAVSLDRQLRATIQRLLLPFVSSRPTPRRPLSVSTLHFYHDPYYCYTYYFNLSFRTTIFSFFYIRSSLYPLFLFSTTHPTYYAASLPTILGPSYQHPRTFSTRYLIDERYLPDLTSLSSPRNRRVDCYQ